MKNLANKLTLCLLIALVLFVTGCAHFVRETEDSRYFGGFVKDQIYVLRTDAILTPDKPHHSYGELLFPGRKFQLVPADTRAATNYHFAKFWGKPSQSPVQALAKFRSGQRVRFVGIETLVDPHLLGFHVSSRVSPREIKNDPPLLTNHIPVIRGRVTRVDYSRSSNCSRIVAGSRAAWTTRTTIHVS